MQDARSFSFKSVGKRSVGCVFHTSLLFCGKGCDLHGRKNVRGFSCLGVADWHSVRAALLRLSIALALWGIFACHGTLAVHWRSLSDGSLQADGWMSSWVVFPLLAGMELLMLELWNSFEQSGFYHRYLEACTLLDTPFLRLTRVILELLLFFGFGFLVPCAEITIMLFN